MPKLSDTQAMLLSTAAQRDSGSLYPLPEQLRPSGGINKAVTALVSRGLAEAWATSDPATACRTDDDLRYGIFITAAGLSAISIEPESGAGTGASPEMSAAKPATNPERRSKAALVLAMLDRAEGATLAELVAVTDWLPKTIRAALTGLRKKGHAVERSKRGPETCYRLVAAAA